MIDLFPETRTFKALSLWQPWAALVTKGVKLHETRHWTTAYRGPIAIAASKTIDVAGAPDRLCASALGMFWRNAVATGAITAIAELRGCHRSEDVAGKITRADLAAGNFGPGRFAWELADVRALIKPIPVVGRQGLFNWAPAEDLEANLGPVLDHLAICRQIGWI